LHPREKRNRHMPYYLFRIHLEDFAILHLYPDGFSAVQAWRIDTNGFFWEKPADRQRFECSLAEPFLLSVDGDAVLIWKVVEGGHRDDKVGLRIQPSGHSGVDQVMESLSAFLHGNTQFLGYLRIMRRLPGFDHAFHDDVERFVKQAGFTHALSPPLVCLCANPCDG
jgi:hypothetical protein